jgi:hypothetical protein
MHFGCALPEKAGPLVGMANIISTDKQDPLVLLLLKYIFFESCGFASMRMPGLFSRDSFQAFPFAA